MAQQGQLVASTLDWLDNNSSGCGVGTAINHVLLKLNILPLCLQTTEWLAAVAFLQSLRSLPGPDATWSALGVVLTSYLSKVGDYEVHMLQW
jgi:hypothetical protein